MENPTEFVRAYKQMIDRSLEKTEKPDERVGKLGKGMERLYAAACKTLGEPDYRKLDEDCNKFMLKIGSRFNRFIVNKSKEHYDSSVVMEKLSGQVHILSSLLKDGDKAKAVPVKKRKSRLSVKANVENLSGTVLDLIRNNPGVDRRTINKTLKEAGEFRRYVSTKIIQKLLVAGLITEQNRGTHRNGSIYLPKV